MYRMIPVCAHLHGVLLLLLQRRLHAAVVQLEGDAAARRRRRRHHRATRARPHRARTAEQVLAVARAQPGADADAAGLRVRVIGRRVDGAVGVGLVLGARLPAEPDDLPEDECVLGERAEPEQDAGQQPDLERRHLGRHGNPGPANHNKNMSKRNKGTLVTCAV